MDVGLSQVIIETGSVNLATTIRLPSYDQAAGGVIFQDIQDMLILHFNLCDVSYVTRTFVNSQVGRE
jgi:hypothetical protein